MKLRQYSIRKKFAFQFIFFSFFLQIQNDMSQFDPILKVWLPGIIPLSESERAFFNAAAASTACWCPLTGWPFVCNPAVKFPSIFVPFRRSGWSPAAMLSSICSRLASLDGRLPSPLLSSPFGLGLPPKWERGSFLVERDASGLDS